MENFKTFVKSYNPKNAANVSHAQKCIEIFLS